MQSRVWEVRNGDKIDLSENPMDDADKNGAAKRYAGKKI